MEESRVPEQNRRVMVAIDDSEESFYTLNWALDNVFKNGQSHHSHEEEEEEHNSRWPKKSFLKRCKCACKRWLKQKLWFWKGIPRTKFVKLLRKCALILLLWAVVGLATLQGFGSKIFLSPTSS
ncbi:PREDICTED: uncharacterized protein LOC109174374 [Ipomoea nil]|uniref:uncharacterized protein LOC109174374 n=1 Tax=Ipomoea nil TaxID=35883 RepID=UPI000901756E|nr:PREDICTED: uncharacterized protein LOC109174374 [Ipomoea nil]